MPPVQKYSISILDLIDKHLKLSGPIQSSYANQTKISLSDSEAIFDFIIISPPISGQKPTVEHVQRIVYPLSHLPSLIKALQEISQQPPFIQQEQDE
jgi:hypothetical protein